MLDHVLGNSTIWNRLLSRDRNMEPDDVCIEKPEQRFRAGCLSSHGLVSLAVVQRKCERQRRDYGDVWRSAFGYHAAAVLQHRSGASLALPEWLPHYLAKMAATTDRSQLTAYGEH
jgi:hypothetical protein